MVSPSQIERLTLCAGSQVLPQFFESSDAAARGTWLHEAIQAKVEGEPMPSCTDDSWRQIAEVANIQELEKHLGGKAEIETALAYNWSTKTARFLGRKLGRKYGELSRTEIPMSFDFLVLNGVPHVCDLKTGPVTHPKFNPQIRVYALGAAAYTQETEVVGSVAHLQADGTWFFTKHTFVAKDLEQINSELREFSARMDRIKAQYKATGQINLAPSEKACKYCPSYKACPAKTALVRSALGIESSMKQKLEALAPSEVAEVWHKHREASIALEKLGDELKAWVRRNGTLDLGNGAQAEEQVYWKEMCTSDTVRMLANITDIQHALEFTSITKVGLKEALQSYAEKQGRDGKEWEQKVMETFRKQGAFESKRSSIVKESAKRGGGKD